MKQINIKLENKSGIYSIFNYVNGKRYVGSSKNIYIRWHEHVHNLNNNKAHNKHLQAAWNKYGEENFRFNVLEYCDEDLRFEREQFYLDLLLPEYNFNSEVNANFNRVISDEQRKQISETLKRKYASGELTPYVRTDLYYDTYVYNIEDFTFCGKFSSIRDTAAALGVNRDTISRKKIIGRIYCKKYIIMENPFSNKLELKNYFFQNFVKALSKTKNINYIISIDENNNMKYYRSYAACAKDLGCSPESLRRHTDATIDNPYIISSKKYCVSDVYIPIQEVAVPIEESLELQLGNNGESCDANPVITEDSNESSVSYSVEGETYESTNI